MTFDEKLAFAAEILKAQKLAFKSFIPYMASARVSAASDDQTKTRELASELAPLVSLADIKTWSVGMTTNPGDIVYDPLEDYKYIFTGAQPMTHNNPTFYPGAAGVYYWAVIPKTKGFIKIYPAIDGIVVAVKQGEYWWNSDQTQVYAWKGVDNANCVWPPPMGGIALASTNEWELVQS